MFLLLTIGGRPPCGLRRRLRFDHAWNVFTVVFIPFFTHYSKALLSVLPIVDNVNTISRRNLHLQPDFNFKRKLNPRCQALELSSISRRRRNKYWTIRSRQPKCNIRSVCTMQQRRQTKKGQSSGGCTNLHTKVLATPPQPPTTKARISSLVGATSFSVPKIYYALTGFDSRPKHPSASSRYVNEKWNIRKKARDTARLLALHIS